MDRLIRRYWWIEVVGVIAVLALFWLFGGGPGLVE